MTKTLVKHGNSLALVIDKPILDLLNITAETPLNVSTDGKHLTVSPADPMRKQKVEAASRQVMEEWHDVFQKLAE